MQALTQRFKSLNMKNQVTILLVVFAAGFVTFGSLAYTTIQKVRIGSAHYQEVVDDKDLLADCLPPLLYVVENYLSSQMMYSSDDAVRAAAVKRFYDFKKKYETSLADWQTRLPDGELKSCINGEVRRTGDAIVSIIENELLPAFKSKDKEAATEASNKINALFTEHQTAIEDLVAKVTKKMDADQAAGENMAASGIWQLVLLGLVCMSFVAVVGLFLRKSIASSETSMRLSKTIIDALDRSMARIEFEPDGTILGANDNFSLATGYDLKEIVGKHHRMFMFENERSSPEYASLWSRLRSGEAVIGEARRVTKGGAELWLQASYNPVFDDKGRVVRVVKIATDITSVVQEREELKKNVNQILSVVTAAAQGDLTRQISISGNGPMAQLGSSLATFFENLSGSIASISENATALAGASEELSAVSAQMSSNASDTASQAQLVSAATEEVNTNVNVVTTGVEELNSAIREIAKNASDAARVSQQAVSIASDTNRTISKLGDSSMEIGKVVKVITSIAEQTNLLALNATIEAARAGEAGKGFAVVANEVKELAKETARATEDISHKIEAIQSDTSGAISAIQEISEVINRINDISNTIASAVEEQTATANEMGRNVAEAARGSAEIAQNITSVADSTQSTTEGANNTMQAATELSRMAGDLQRLVGQFKYHQNSLTKHRESAVMPQVTMHTFGVHETV